VLSTFCTGEGGSISGSIFFSFFSRSPRCLLHRRSGHRGEFWPALPAAALWPRTRSPGRHDVGFPSSGDALRCRSTRVDVEMRLTACLERVRLERGHKPPPRPRCSTEYCLTTAVTTAGVISSSKYSVPPHTPKGCHHKTPDLYRLMDLDVSQEWLKKYLFVPNFPTRRYLQGVGDLSIRKPSFLFCSHRLSLQKLANQKL